MNLLSSVKKSLEVLQVFSGDQLEMSVTEISKVLNSHKSSISRILITLASEGFVEKNPQTNKYRLGLKVLELASLVMQRYDLREHAGPYMEELAQRLGEITQLSLLDGNEIVYLEKKGQGQTLTVATKVGGKHPAHASAMGKVLLSGLSNRELSDILAIEPLVKCTPHTISEMPELLKELDQVKKRGFALDDEEGFLGIRCVAAPIYNREGKIISAMSTTVPKQRMGDRRTNEIRKQIVETTRLISERIRVFDLRE